MSRANIEVSIQELYIGILGRAADYLGLKYWADQIEADAMTLENTRAAFASPNQSEYWSTYGGLSESALVDKVYENFLERAPDVEGKEYWVSELTSGVITSDFFVSAIINAAKSPSATDRQTVLDAQVLADKVECAQYFTATAQAGDSNSASFIAQAKSAVTGMDYIPQSVYTSKAATDQYVLKFLAPSYYDDRVNDADGSQITYTIIASDAHVDGVVNTQHSATSSDIFDGFQFMSDKDGVMTFNFSGSSDIFFGFSSYNGYLMDNETERAGDDEFLLNYQNSVNVSEGEIITIDLAGSNNFDLPQQSYSFDISIV